MKALVTGGAGFIGSALCASLVKGGHEVTAFDNLSSGSEKNLAALSRSPGFRFVKGDCKVEEDVTEALRDANTVFHLAANPEVRQERASPRESFDENVVATKVLLEAVRGSDVREMVFASTSTVYGEPTVLPTPESYSPLVPISVYGATKLASEALVSAFAKSFSFDARILRLANIVGPRGAHGVIFDFVRKLRRDPTRLVILGDGTQRKSYLYVDDCVRAMIEVLHREERVSFYNVGSKDQVSVTEIADIICGEMEVSPAYRFTGGVDGGRGWRGDVKEMLLDTARIESLGWRPKYDSAQAVRKTAFEILKKG
ncbi:MAG: NAD-dependent epimerase/dehydratase family protein [Conexivisphaerales archaeon]